MTVEQIETRFRRSIGNPQVGDVTRQSVFDFLEESLIKLASMTEWKVKTDEISGRLVASEQTLPLPEDFLVMLWVEWNGNRLTPGDVVTWNVENRDWHNPTSGSPSEYAIERRTLILNPPPSAAAIVTDSSLAYRFVSSDGHIGPAGVEDIGDAELLLAIYMGADQWLVQHPSEENMARRQGLAPDIGRMQLEAKRRVTGNIKPHRSRWHFKTRRVGAAR